MSRFCHPRWMLITAMAVFGTLGLFVRNISVSSGELALYRAILASVLLALYLLVTKQPLELRKFRRELPLLLLSGVAMGFNWILLFEAYRYTTVATATMCYYFAPVIVMALSPLVGERLTLRKICCILAAVVGMVFVSGMAEGGLPTAAEGKGVLLGLGAAALYASVMLMNRRLTALRAYDKTILQLGAATVVLLPYVLLTGSFNGASLTAGAALLLLVVGVVHTGVAYACYFGSMRVLRAQTVALFSYLDPVVAILLSATVLGESVSVMAFVGAGLIIGSAVISER